MNSEFVVLVDENDQVIGYEEKIKAHEKALCHRAFSIFIMDQDKILLQRRHSNKYHCGNLWTNTCCGHPRPHEEILDAAHRRLMQEMGIETKLTLLGKFHYIAPFDNGLTENEIDYVFVGALQQPDFIVNPEEVSEYQWMRLSDLQVALAATPHLFTPWLDRALTILAR